MSNATFGTNVESFIPLWIKCNKCDNVWLRAFIANKRISCSKCKTSIMMPTAEGYAQLKEEQTQKAKQNNLDDGELMYSIPYSALMDRKFRKALSWAEANGEDMYFQVDDEYRLILR